MTRGCNLRMVAERVALVGVQVILDRLAFWGIHLTTRVVVRAMADGRDRSPRPRKRGSSMPDRPAAPSDMPEAASVRLESRMLSMAEQMEVLNQKIRDLTTVVQQQQSTFQQTQAAFQQTEQVFKHHQVQIDALTAQSVRVPPSPRPVVSEEATKPVLPINARSSPFQASAPEPVEIPLTSGDSVPATSNPTGRAPKLVWPDGTEFVFGMSQSVPVQTTKKESSSSTTPDALQKSDKWLPSLPVLDTRAWKSRTDEILGFESWVESFVAWIGLVSEPFATEIRYAVSAPAPIVQADLSSEQESRGSRLLSMLRQIFKDVPKAKIILLAYSEAIQPHSKNGFEALRLVAKEYMIRSRQEILHFRSSLLQQTVKSGSVMELVKHLEFEESRYQKLLNMLPPNMSQEGLGLQASDLSMLLLRSLPVQVREYVTMHASSDSYNDLKIAAQKHEAGQRLWAEIGGNTHSKYLHEVFDRNPKGGKPKGGKGKDVKGGKDGKQRGSDHTSSPFQKDSGDSNKERSDKEKNATCFRCGRKGHFKTDCHAKTDQNGRALTSDSPPKSTSKPNVKGGPGSGKGKDKGKKGKGKGGKIHELIGEQPDEEASPVVRQPMSEAARAAAPLDSQQPLSPFVANGPSSFSSSCLKSMSQFERDLDKHIVYRYQPAKVAFEDCFVLKLVCC